MTNPTLFVAKPFLRVYGYGQFTNRSDPGVLVIIDDTGTEYVDIDCETMNVYYGDTNLASYVGFRDLSTSRYGVDAPTFAPGETGIHLIDFAHITKIEVTPRWWEV